MTYPPFLLPVAGMLLLSLASPGNAQEIGSAWRLRIDDTQQATRVDATLRFTDEPANACIGGGWKRVVVETVAARADDFFPLSTPLAYKREGDALTVGRTHVCDGYLFLRGVSAGTTVAGSYDAVGWGSRRLGTFSLRRLPPSP